ncbi:hypothetical protein J2847_000829 [Azospirillum agricola]|nr:hypothetical protein [Azospirillum agricola]
MPMSVTGTPVAELLVGDWTRSGQLAGEEHLRNVIRRRPGAEEAALARCRRTRRRTTRRQPSNRRTPHRRRAPTGDRSHTPQPLPSPGLPHAFRVYPGRCVPPRRRRRDGRPGHSRTHRHSPPRSAGAASIRARCTRPPDGRHSASPAPHFMDSGRCGVPSAQFPRC